MGRLTPAVGFLALSVTTLLLFGLSSFEALGWHSPVGIGLKLVLIGLLIGTVFELRALYRARPLSSLGQKDFFSFASLSLGRW